LEYRNYFGIGVKIAALDILVDAVEEVDKFDGSTPNEWFVVGLIKFCRRR
jgi:hypothetical protein